MNIYLVGGAVRDILLGLTPKDKDYVVVGATEQDMLDQGFSKVGADFPVFLHPLTREEYALARKERKVAAGYNGFAVDFDPSVTLAEDLIRRDLTINSMAQESDGTIFDPYGGQADLTNRILRHTSDVFADDPVRVLRLARFAARYNTFTVDPSTVALAQSIVHELNNVPQERIWAEFEKGLMESHPLKMLQVLDQCKAFTVDALVDYASCDMHYLKNVSRSSPLYARAVWIMTSPVWKIDDTVYHRHCVPNDIAKVSQDINMHLAALYNYVNRDCLQRLELLSHLRVFNNTDNLDRCVEAMRIMDSTWYQEESIDRMYADIAHLKKTVDVQSIVASANGNGQLIKQLLFNARLDSLMSQR